MANILLWIENLAVGLLWTAMWAACLMRMNRLRLRRWLTVLVVGGPLLVFHFPLLGLAGFSWAAMGVRGHFVGLALLILAFIAGSCWIFWRAFRSAPPFWSRSGLAITWLAALLLHLITLSSIDLSVRIRLASMQSEARSLVLSVIPPSLPPEQNAAVDYRRAFALMDAGRPWHEKWNDQWDTWLGIACSSCSPVKESESVDLEAVGRFLQENAPVLTHLRRGAAKPVCNFERPWGRLDFFALLSPDMHEIRAAGRLLGLSARWKIAQGDTPGALRDLRDMLRLAEHLGQEPLLISTLICMGIRQNVVNLLQLLFNEAALQSSDLDMIQIALEHSTPASRLIGRSMQVEMAVGISHWVALSEGRSIVDVYRSLQGSNVPLSSGVSTVGSPLGTWYRIFLALDDLTSYRTAMNQYIYWSSQPYDKVRSNMETLARSSSKSTVGFLTRLLLPAMHAGLKRVAESEAQMRCLQAALAVKRYQLDHARWPDDWAALCPDYLDQPPIDPYTGQPLQMKVKEKDHTFIIYSLGPDSRDDDGAPFDRKAQTGDIVFRLRY